MFVDRLTVSQYFYKHSEARRHQHTDTGIDTIVDTESTMRERRFCRTLTQAKRINKHPHTDKKEREMAGHYKWTNGREREAKESATKKERARVHARREYIGENGRKDKQSVNTDT